MVVKRAISKFNELSFEEQIEFFMKNSDMERVWELMKNDAEPNDF